jgi:DNA-binding MarR family transcriptional regulator/GNAT superfamily N-acetyltransferase
MAASPRVEAIRGFNRFYTKQIGLLYAGYLKTPFSVSEARVLYEIAHHPGITASVLAKKLALDAGYLSRILLKFDKLKLIRRQPSENDGRQSCLTLTRKGHSAFSPLENGANGQVAAMLAPLSEPDQSRLIQAMQIIEQLLDADHPRTDTPYVLRPHQTGDMGWVIHRHGVLYAQEHGWDERFEALVAEIAAHFIQHFDTRRERCWIAERDGAIIGSVFLVQKSKTVAKLRLLLVEPSARGLGLGGRLVEECIRFARQAGYRKITLWTQSILLAARKIYERNGFRLVSKEPHQTIGRHLIGETWELKL